MLKITLQRGAAPTLLLEGRLVSPWVDELGRCWEARSPEEKRVRVDLSGLTFIAPEGKALLARMWQDGAVFHASGCMTRAIVEEITRQPAASGGCNTRADR